MAYNLATITKNEPLPEGRIRLFVSFSGNAGEPPVERDIYLDGSTTALSLKQWAIGQAAALNSARNIGRAAGLQPGQAVDLTAIVTPAPTAKETFISDVTLLSQMDRAVKLTVKTTADSDYTAQLTKVKNALSSNPGWIDAF